MLISACPRDYSSKGFQKDYDLTNMFTNAIEVDDETTLVCDIFTQRSKVHIVDTHWLVLCVIRVISG